MPIQGPNTTVYTTEPAVGVDRLTVTVTFTLLDSGSAANVVDVAPAATVQFRGSGSGTELIRVSRPTAVSDAATSADSLSVSAVVHLRESPAGVDSLQLPFTVLPHGRTFAVVASLSPASRPPVDGGSASSTMQPGYNGGNASSTMVDGVDGNYVDLIPVGVTGRTSAVVITIGRTSAKATTHGATKTLVVHSGRTGASSL